MTSDKTLHWPPGAPCHASCIVIILASHEARQIPISGGDDIPIEYE